MPDGAATSEESSVSGATVAEDRAERAALSLEKDSDGVAWLVFDRPDSRVNLLTTGVMLRLDELLGEVEALAGAGRVKALVVRSRKPDNFIAGADVDEIASLSDAEDGAAKSRAGQRILRRLELLEIPTIAAIDGACLGGGAELTLACGHRLATDRGETRIGFPEVRLGILPGFGGTVRLPRLVGLRAATEMIVTGKTVSARRALSMGLVDRLVPAPIFDQQISRFAWALVDAAPGSRWRRRRPGLGQRLLDETAPGRRLVLAQARRQVLRETRGHYPAPLRALDTLRANLEAPLDEAFDRESRALGELAAGPVAKNLIHVFRLFERAKKSPVGAAPRPVSRALVVGAGTMGGGIAHLLARHGIAVRLVDIREEALSAGLRHAAERFARDVARRRLTRREARHLLELISPALNYDGVETADVVVEAVVERMDVKKQVLAELERRASPASLLASNTSSLSISEMQEVLSRPANFCGLHFFNPVHRMPLVEIVRGRATGDEAVATAFELARRLGKTPVVVGDGAGFVVNRVLAPYLNEAGWLLAEGASIESIDGALEAFGMPMGPLRLLDEVGHDIARHVAAVLGEVLGERLAPAPPLIAMAGTDRLGKKSGRGFYLHGKGDPRVDPHVYDELGGTVPRQRHTVPAEAIQARCVFAMINEAARVLEEGVARDAGDVDLGMIAGTGFPPFRGGLLRYADELGPGVVLDRLRALASELGPRFVPVQAIEERAAAGRGFYG